MIRKINLKNIDKVNLNNLKVNKTSQIDDFFDYSKVVVKKPWGYEYLIYQNGIVAVWILHIKKDHQTSMHCHPNKKTSLIVLVGDTICSTLNENFKLMPGEGLLIDKSVFHCSKSVSEEGSFIMEIETPANKRDLVRLKDEYGRVSKGYETINDMSFNLHNYNYISLIQPEIYYNVKKKIGKCSISLHKFSNNKEFKEKFKLEDWNAISILKGKILDENKNIILEVGDTIDLDSMKFYKNMIIDNELEVITIKKIDNLVKISDYVVSLLEKNNIKNVFLVPGSTNVHLLDSIGKNININHIILQTECGAAITAEAYSKLIGDIGVVIISSGVSGTNALSGIADSWVDSTPLMIISGQAQSDQIADGSQIRQLGVQELDIIDIVKPITKYAVKIKDPKEIKYHLEKAIFLAKRGRPGPVWIDIPTDIQGMSVDEEEFNSFDINELQQSNDITKLNKQILETLNLVKNSKRPVILAGNGIRLAGAENEFIQFIEKLSIPVLTSRRGADIIPENHPLFFGRPGAYGIRSANFIIQNSDLLISIGSRLTIPLIGRNFKAFARKAKKVVVDIDKSELEKKTIKSDISINLCAKEFIKRILNNIENYNPANILEWIKKCEKWKTKFSTCPEYRETKDGYVNSYFFVETLSDNLKEGDIITVDGVSSIIFIMQAFKFKPKQRLITATGLENTSFALVASIGASIGSNCKDIICITENQGFQNNVHELETIVKYKLPIKIFILNTKSYSYILKTQKEYFGGRYVASDTTGLQCPLDIHKIGNAYNILTFRINSHKELKDNLQKILMTPRPIICDINVDKNQQIVPRITFTVKPDGKWIAKPLEDMYPLLDREELKENMIIDNLEED